MKSNKILFIGCGDLAAHTINAIHCLSQTDSCFNVFDIYGLRRNIHELPKTNLPIIPICLDLNNPQAFKLLHDHLFDYIIITLTPDEFSEEAYQKSYYQNLSNILQFLENKPPKHLFWISSTAVYGETHQGKLDETFTPIPTHFRGQILLRSEQLLEGAHFPSTILRLSGIYGGDRLSVLNAAQNLAQDFSMQTQFSNRIHIQDAACFITHLLHLLLKNISIAPLYLVTDDQPTEYCHIISWIQQKLGIKQNMTSEQHLGQDAALKNNHSRYFSNQFAKSTGWKPAYPSFKEGLQIHLNTLLSLKK